MSAENRLAPASPLNMRMPRTALLVVGGSVIVVIVGGMVEFPENPFGMDLPTSTDTDLLSYTRGSTTELPYENAFASEYIEPEELYRKAIAPYSRVFYVAELASQILENKITAVNELVEEGILSREEAKEYQRLVKGFRDSTTELQQSFEDLQQYIQSAAKDGNISSDEYTEMTRRGRIFIESQKEHAKCSNAVDVVTTATLQVHGGIKT